MQPKNIGDYNMDNNYHNPNDNWYYNQRYDMNSVGSMKGCFYSLIGIIITIVSLLFTSCKTQYVPVETVRTEIVNVHDTIKQTDSVKTETNTIIRESRPEDSLMLAELGIKLKDNERLLILLQRQLSEKNNQTYESHNKDSVRVDSIQVPYPVERKLSKWEQIKMDMGGIAMVVLVVIIILMLLRWLIRRR